jgi:acetate kinase
MYHYRIRKYIGSYAAAMEGVDVVVFTGGVGENGPESREAICKGFEYMGLDFDQEVNFGKRGKEIIITKPGSKVVTMVIPTNEELVIATDTMRIVNLL